MEKLNSKQVFERFLRALQEITPEQVLEYEWHLTSVLNTFCRHYCHLLSEEPPIGNKQIEPVFLEVPDRRFTPLFAHSRLINLYIVHNKFGDDSTSPATCASIHLEIQYTSSEKDASNVKYKSVIESIPILNERIAKRTIVCLSSEIDEKELPVPPDVYPPTLMTYNTFGVTKHPLKLLLVNEETGLYRDAEGSIEILFGLQGFYVDKRFIDTTADIRSVWAPNKPDLTWRIKDFPSATSTGLWHFYKTYLFGHPSKRFIESQFLLIDTDGGERWQYVPSHRLQDCPSLSSPSLIYNRPSDKEEKLLFFFDTIVQTVVVVETPPPIPHNEERDKEYHLTKDLLQEYQTRNDELQQEISRINAAHLEATQLLDEHIKYGSDTTSAVLNEKNELLQSLESFKAEHATIVEKYTMEVAHLKKHHQEEKDWEEAIASETRKELLEVLQSYETYKAEHTALVDNFKEELTSFMKLKAEHEVIVNELTCYKEECLAHREKVESLTHQLGNKLDIGGGADFEETEKALRSLTLELERVQKEHDATLALINTQLESILLEKEEEQY